MKILYADPYSDTPYSKRYLYYEGLYHALTKNHDVLLYRDCFTDYNNIKNDIPFIDETKNMKSAIGLITKKKLGILIAINKKKLTTGIITDGQLRRASHHNKNILSLKVKDVMTKDPLSVNKDTLAAKSLSIMSENKITSLCVHKNKNKKKTIGILHIHHILNANIQ